jgi:hypothetical protein
LGEVFEVGLIARGFPDITRPDHLLGWRQCGEVRARGLNDVYRNALPVRDQLFLGRKRGQNPRRSDCAGSSDQGTQEAAAVHGVVDEPWEAANSQNCLAVAITPSAVGVLSWLVLTPSTLHAISMQRILAWVLAMLSS